MRSLDIHFWLRVTADRKNVLERFNSTLTRADDIPEYWCFNRGLGAGMETTWRNVSGVFIPQMQSPDDGGCFVKSLPCLPKSCSNSLIMSRGLILSPKHLDGEGTEYSSLGCDVLMEK